MEWHGLICVLERILSAVLKMDWGQGGRVGAAKRMKQETYVRL